MIGFLLYGMLFHTIGSMMRILIAVIAVVFCGFIQTEVSLGITSVFSQDKWLKKTVHSPTGNCAQSYGKLCTVVREIYMKSLKSYKSMNIGT